MSREWANPLMSAALGGSELIRARYADRVFPRHAHADAILGAVLDGGKRSRCGSRELAVSSGMTIMLNPFEEHESHPEDGGWAYAAVYPSHEAAAWATDDGSTPHFPNALSNDPRLSSGIAGLYAAVASGTVSPLSLQATLLTLLALAHGDATAPRFRGDETNAVRRVVDILEADMSAQLDLGDLAAETGLPRLRLLRSFRRRVGCTPCLYRTARRVWRAKRLLLARHPIVDVALQLGFYDQSHFTRVFRRSTGLTPAHYIRAAG